MHAYTQTLYLLVSLNCTKTHVRVNEGSQGAVYCILLPVSHYRTDVIKDSRASCGKHAQTFSFSISVYL